MAASMPWSRGSPWATHAGGVAVDPHLRAVGDQGGDRSTADERPAAPPLTVLDRLEEEPGLVARAEPGEGRDRA